MKEISLFFGTVRKRLGTLKQNQVDGLITVLDACDGLPLSHAAYALATCWHETNATMQPVREAYWLSENWRKTHLRYYPWYGRGYVQLTWETNYERAQTEIALSAQPEFANVDLIERPDDAMRPDVAAFILRRGMEGGWFTGVKLADVLPLSGVASRQQYMNARTIINGRDKADLIEDYAQVFERALRDGDWT